MPIDSIDRRTRYDHDVVDMAPDRFFEYYLPGYLARHGQLAAAGFDTLRVQPLAIAVLEGWPVVDPTLRFVDRNGAALDLERCFTPEDDPSDAAHFLREAGYLHLRGWLDAGDMAAVADDIDRALPHYRDGDDRS